MNILRSSVSIANGLDHTNGAGADHRSIEIRVEDHFDRLGYQPTPAQRDAFRRILLAQSAPPAKQKLPTRYGWLKAFTERAPKSPGLRCVLFVLFHHMGEKGTGRARCWPSQELIAREAGCTRKTLKKYLGEAIASGWLLTKELRRNGGQNWRYTLYQGVIPEPKTHEPAAALIDPPDFDDNSDVPF
jgi:hypothetical protein